MKHNQFEIIQFNTKCLSQFCYYIESENECVVIDPLRDFENLEETIKSRGTQLKYIILTHFHADFVAGHFELQKKFGVPIIMGPVSSPLPSVNLI